MTTARSAGELFLRILDGDDVVAGTGRVDTVQVDTVQVEADIGATFENLDIHVEHPIPIDEFFHPPDVVEQEALATLLSSGPTSALDIGAGSGRISLWFASHGVRVTACEIDSDLARYCRSQGLTDVRTDPFQHLDACYDAVVLFGQGIPSLGPVDDVDAHLTSFLDEVLARVQPGGHLLLDTTEYNAERLLGERATVVARIRYRLGDLVSPHAHYLYPERAELMQRLEARGATLVRQWRVPYPEDQIDARWMSIWRKAPGG